MSFKNSQLSEQCSSTHLLMKKFTSAAHGGGSPWHLPIKRLGCSLGVVGCYTPAGTSQCRSSWSGVTDRPPVPALVPHERCSLCAFTNGNVADGRRVDSVLGVVLLTPLSFQPGKVYTLQPLILGFFTPSQTFSKTDRSGNASSSLEYLATWMNNILHSFSVYESLTPGE